MAPIILKKKMDRLNKTSKPNLPGPSNSNKKNSVPDIAGIEAFLKSKMTPDCDLRIALEDSEEESSEGESSDVDNENVIEVHMDVQKPLEYLRGLLETKTGRSLIGFPFTLQKSQFLDSSKNLVEQCVDGEGFVQVNVKIEDDPSLPVFSIDILDVLKPADSVANDIETPPLNKVDVNNSIDISDSELQNWVGDSEFRQNQIRLGIPINPGEWNEAHVRHWMVWAVRKFDLSHIKLFQWRGYDGKKLVSMSRADFTSKVPKDPGHIFWTHFVILCRCHVVAVPKPEVLVKSMNKRALSPDKDASSSMSTSLSAASSSSVGLSEISPASSSPSSRPSEPLPGSQPTTSASNVVETLNPSQPPSRLGGSGEQGIEGCLLWQFLLELLTDRRFLDVICWLPHEGEFILLKPEVVGTLWGRRKGLKDMMPYDKLILALRQYRDSDGHVITEVPGRNHVYKFGFDLKFLVGYSSLELRKLMDEPTSFRKSFAS